MKRDLDLVRKLLMRFEEMPLRSLLHARDIDMPPWTSDEIVYHCRLMLMSGLAEGVDVQSMRRVDIEVTGLTAAGHDFLDAARSDTVWNKVKAKAAEEGVSMTLEMAKAMLIFYGKKYLGLT